MERRNKEKAWTFPESLLERGSLARLRSTQNSNPLLSIFDRTKALLDLWKGMLHSPAFSEEFTLLDPPPSPPSRTCFKFFILTFLSFLLSIFSPLCIILYAYQFPLFLFGLALGLWKDWLVNVYS